MRQLNKIRIGVLSVFLMLCIIMNTGLVSVFAAEQSSEVATENEAGKVLFSENFSSGLSNWQVKGGESDKVTTVDSISGKMLYVNQLKVSSTCEVIANGEYTDFVMENEFCPEGGSYFGWFFRYESGYKTYLLQYYASSQEFKLLVGNGSAFKELASKVVPLDMGTIYTIRISAFGDKINAYLNGDKVFGINDDSRKNGKIGFRVLSADVSFGNLVVATNEEALDFVQADSGNDGELLNEDFEDGAGGWKFTQNYSAFSIAKIYDASKLKFQDYDNMLEAGTMLYGNNAWNDYSVELELTPVVTGYTGILFCYRDVNNHYLLQFYGTDKVRLLKRENGYFSYKAIASATCTVKRNEVNQIKIDVEGNAITVSIGEKTIMHVSDNAPKTGKIGIRGMRSMFYVDNVKVFK